MGQSVERFAFVRFLEMVVSLNCLKGGSSVGVILSNPYNVGRWWWWRVMFIVLKKMVQYEAAIIIAWLFYSHFVFNGILIIVHLYTLDQRAKSVLCPCAFSLNTFGFGGVDSRKKNFFLFGWDHSYVLSSSDLKKGKVVFKLGMCECLFISSSGRLLQHEQQQTKAFHSAFRSPVMPFQCFIKITLTFVMCINVRFCSIYSHYISLFLIFPFPLAAFEFFEC